MKKTIIIAIICLLTVSAHADYGYYGDAFIMAGRSAKSIAMGNTGLTSLNGISSVVTNPAGLIGIREKEVFTQYNSLFGLATQNSIGLSMPFGQYQVGIMLNTVGVQLNYRDDIINTIPNINDRREYVRQALELDTFYDLETALLMSVARETPIDIKMGWSYDRFTVYLQYGLNVKLIYKSLDSESAFGGGIDAGLRLIVPGDEIFYIKNLGKISIGLNLENLIQSPIIWFNHLNDYGNMRIVGGVALHQPLKFAFSEVTVALDGYVYESNFLPGYGVRYGLQWNIKDFIDLRFGRDFSSFTGGAGLKFDIPGGKLRVDYSIQKHEINWSHLVSISYNWGVEK